MGMETAIMVMAGVAAAGEVGKMSMEQKAADAQVQALNLQSKQDQVQYQQKTLSNLDVLQKVLDSQTAQMSVSGAAFSSPSFNAIQRATENIGSKKQRNLNIEEDLMQSNIDNEKDNVRSKLYSQLFGDVSDLAVKGIGIATGMPMGSRAGMPAYFSKAALKG